MFFPSLFLVASVAITLQFSKHVSHNSILMFLVLLVCYVLMHLVYLFVFWLLSLPIDRSKPLPRQRYTARMACMGVASMLCSYMGIKVVVRGREKLPKDETFVFVSNHRSMFDPLIVMDKLRSRNISFISKPSNMKIPLVGDIAYQAGFLPIDRENDREALKTILTAADYVKRGVCSIGIYPEGTRSPNEELLPFHAGSFKIAQKAGCKLVIASIRGTENSKKFLTDRKKTAYLDILEVLEPEQVQALSTQKLSEYAKATIQLALYTPEDVDPTVEPERDEADDYEADYDEAEDLAEVDEPAEPEEAGEPGAEDAE